MSLHWTAHKLLASGDKWIGSVWYSEHMGLLLPTEIKAWKSNYAPHLYADAMIIIYLITIMV